MSNDLVGVDKPQATSGLIFACLLNVCISGINAVANVAGLMVVLLLLPTVAADTLLLGRRVAIALAALLQCGGSHTLQKYLSLFSNNPSKKLSFECAAISLWAIGSCALLCLVSLYPEVVSNFITNNGQTNFNFILSVVSLASAMAIGHLAASTLLADGKILVSGLYTLVSGPFLMLVVVITLAPTQNLSGMFFLQAALTAVIAFLIVTFYVLHWQTQQSKSLQLVPGLVPEFKKAVLFGMPRAVSSSSEYMLLAIAPWYLSSVPGKASAFITATMFVRSLQMLVAPASQILGLSIAQLKIANELSSIDKKIYKSAFILWGFGVIFAGVVWVGNNFLSDYIFSSVSSKDQIKYFIGLVCWAIPPSIVFYSFRNVIEMRWVFPFNLVILSLALGSQVTIIELFPHDDFCFLVGLAFVLSFWLCGIGATLTLWIGAQRSGVRPAGDGGRGTTKFL